MPRYISFLIWYPCIVVQVVLFSYADVPGSDRYKRVGHEVSFELVGPSKTCSVSEGVRGEVLLLPQPPDHVVVQQDLRAGHPEAAGGGRPIFAELRRHLGFAGPALEPPLGPGNGKWVFVAISEPGFKF